MTDKADIVERLRAELETFTASSWPRDLFKDAAAEIERLRAGRAADPEAVEAWAKIIWAEIVKEEEPEERPARWEDEHPDHQATYRRAAATLLASASAVPPWWRSAR